MRFHLTNLARPNKRDRVEKNTNLILQFHFPSSSRLLTSSIFFTFYWEVSVKNVLGDNHIRTDPMAHTNGQKIIMFLGFKSHIWSLRYF